MANMFETPCLHLRKCGRARRGTNGVTFISSGATRTEARGLAMRGAILSAYKCRIPSRLKGHGTKLPMILLNLPSFLHMPEHAKGIDNLHLKGIMKQKYVSRHFAQTCSLSASSPLHSIHTRASKEEEQEEGSERASLALPLSATSIETEGCFGKWLVSI